MSSYKENNIKLMQGMLNKNMSIDSIAELMSEKRGQASFQFRH